LISWELDVRTKTGVPAEPAAVLGIKTQEPGGKQEAAVSEADITVDQIEGIGEKTAGDLKEAGFKTARDLVNTDISEITKIKGIGEKRAEKIKAEAMKALKL